MKKQIKLTQHMSISSTSHILYIYENTDRYIDNMIAYIKDGITRGHHLLIIENSIIYSQVEPKVRQLFSEEEKTRIHYIDNHLFYRCYEDFHMSTIINHFSELLEPFLLSQIIVRTWAHVEWKGQNNIFTKIAEFEKLANYSVNNLEVISVCAYCSTDLPASVQTNIMYSHEYIMTDYELSKSTLYKKGDFKNKISWFK